MGLKKNRNKGRFNGNRIVKLQNGVNDESLDIEEEQIVEEAEDGYAVEERIEEPVVETVVISEEEASQEVEEETIADELAEDGINIEYNEEEESEEEVAEELADESEVEEVPLEYSDEEQETILAEEGSLDGSEEEVEEVASEESEEVEDVEPIEEVEEPTEEPCEEVITEETEEQPAEEATVEEVEVEKVTPAEPEVEESVEEIPTEATAEESEEETTVEVEATEDAVEETPVVEDQEEATDEEAVEELSEAPAEEEEEEVEETSTETEPATVEGKPVEEENSKEFKLTAPANLNEVLTNICAKRARKLIYKPADIILEHTTTVLGTDKNNEENIKVKSILDAEIKQGIKLGYLDKFDGLKGSELKEEYENDIVYELAEQEFKRTGLLLDGDKVKVYIYDWDMKACHHVGYISDESATLVKPYLEDREKYSFDVNGIITGGKYKKITKDPETGKITVEKGNDGNLGVEIDITIVPRKD